MFPGTTFKLGEKDYVIPALTLGQLKNGMIEKIKQHDEVAAKVGLPDSGVSFFDVGLLKVNIIGEAIRRNYPDLKDDELEKILDLANVGPIWLSILGASGFSPGGSSGGGGQVASYDVWPVYRRLAAAYGWAEEIVDNMTLLNANKYFEGWGDAPPTYVLVKAMLEGFGGKIEDKGASEGELAELERAAGSALPVVRGIDLGLPSGVVLDIDALRDRNKTRALHNIKRDLMSPMKPESKAKTK